MLQLLAWALLTGGITGGVWVGIVLVQRQQRLGGRHQAALADAQARLEALERSEERLVAAEERLDYTEHLLARASEATRSPVPHRGENA
jgi:hypothetical protein